MTLAQQLAAAERELALRMRFYPGFVKSRRMTPVEAEYEVQAMAAIVLTLKGLQE